MKIDFFLEQFYHLNGESTENAADFTVRQILMYS